MNIFDDQDGLNLIPNAGKKKPKAGELLLTSMIDVFSVLVIFLLMTAELIQLAVVDLSLPSINKSEGRRIQQEQQQTLVLIILAIREDGFQLKSLGFKFDPVYKVKNNYDYPTLIKQLKEIKDKYAAAQDIIISPEAKIKYDIIIKVMDRCRETGFPNVSLAG